LLILKVNDVANDNAYQLGFKVCKVFVILIVSIHKVLIRQLKHKTLLLTGLYC